MREGIEHFTPRRKNAWEAICRRNDMDAVGMAHTDDGGVLQLSTRSVAAGNILIDMPDFTRDGWKALKPFGVVA